MLEIWTDGSCLGNGNSINKGGWSYVVVKDSQIIDKKYGSEKNTTNNRMELTAVLKAVMYANINADLDEEVIIYSDSAYVINCFVKKWYVAWKERNFANVKNVDLWTPLIHSYEAYFNSEIKFVKVKGHKGIMNNEICDMLAKKGSEEA